MQKIGIVGACGKMGRELVSICEKDPNIQIVRKITRSHRDLDFPLDMLIDFSSVTSLLDNLLLAVEKGCPIVIGTTGFKEKDHDLVQKYAKKIPIFYAENFSLGIAITKKLVQQVYQFFGQEQTIDISETHHLEKKDKPSGSAIALNKLVDNKATVISYRRPKVVGNHTIVFSLEEQEIEIAHRAKTRTVFAKGAVECAKFLHRKPAGLYNMDDYVREINGKCLLMSGC